MMLFDVIGYIFLKLIFEIFIYS